MLASITMASMAQSTTPAEEHHVKVTMANGDTISGYVQKYWFEGTLLKRPNYSFTMSPTPDGKGARQYDADEVTSITFTQKTSKDGRYDHLVSMPVATPTMFNKGKTKQCLVYVEQKGESGDIYWWNGYDQQDMQLGKLNISTIYGFRLKGDNVVVPFMTGSVVSLNAMRLRYKKTQPELVEWLDRQIMRGGKKLWTQMASQPGIFMDLCNEYYKSH